MEILPKYKLMDVVQQHLKQREPTVDNIEAVRVELEYDAPEAYRSWERHELDTDETGMSVAQEFATLLDPNSGREGFGLDDEDLRIMDDDGTGNVLKGEK